MKQVVYRMAAATLAWLALAAHAAPPLGAYAARLDLTTVSGMSAGGAMAEQFGIAHSSLVIGLGLVAAPPYFCAGFRDGRRSDTTLFNALEACMNPAKVHAAPPDAALLWSEAQALAARGAIDDVAKLRRQRVYAFSGARDEYVTRVVMDQTVRLHQMAGVAPGALVYVTGVQAGHGFIVDDRRALPCAANRVPFVNDCALPMAWHMLRHLYAAAAPLRPPTGAPAARVLAFDQRAFAGPLTGLADTGYVYVPPACRRGGCMVHVAFHGCRQSAATVDGAFVEGAGFNAVADRNRLIVLYPQVRPATLPFDPFACWDFWGYAGPGDFHTRAGTQIRAVRAMLARLAEPPEVLIPRRAPADSRGAHHQDARTRAMHEQEWKPVDHSNCADVKGPFYHGTRSRLAVGDLLAPGHASNYEEGRISNNVYFSALLEPAIWGAELACALAGEPGRGHIYLVEPTGAFEDDPNLTNKRFPGNPTRSYRTRQPLRIVGEVHDWQGHPPEVLQRMLDGLAEKKRQGLAAIED